MKTVLDLTTSNNGRVVVNVTSFTNHDQVEVGIVTDLVSGDSFTIKRDIHLTVGHTQGKVDVVWVLKETYDTVYFWNPTLTMTKTQHHRALSILSKALEQFDCSYPYGKDGNFLSTFGSGKTFNVVHLDEQTPVQLRVRRWLTRGEVDKLNWVMHTQVAFQGDLGTTDDAGNAMTVTYRIATSDNPYNDPKPISELYGKLRQQMDPRFRLKNNGEEDEPLRDDIIVKLYGHNRVDFYGLSGSMWLPELTFRVSGDIGTLESTYGDASAIDGVVTLLNRLETVPHANVGTFEAAANLATSQYAGMVAQAVADLKRNLRYTRQVLKDESGKPIITLSLDIVPWVIDC